MSENTNYENSNTEQENKAQDYDYGEPVQYGSRNDYQDGFQDNTARNYQDPYRNTPPEEPAGMAIASLVLGIISVVMSCSGYNFITAILAIIFGAIHLAKRRSRRGMAIAGIVLGIISIAIFIIAVVVLVAVIGTNPDIMHMYNEMLNEL